MNARLTEIEKHIADAKYDDMPEHHKMIRDLLAEIARLRGELREAEQEIAVLGPSGKCLLCSELQRERNEALAQVAVLLACRHGDEDRCGCRSNIPAAAHAFLDRLQRAEKVVRDLVDLGDDWIDVESAGFYRVQDAAQEIVAAWEDAGT